MKKHVLRPVRGTPAAQFRPVFNEDQAADAEEEEDFDASDSDESDADALSDDDSDTDAGSRSDEDAGSDLEVEEEEEVENKEEAEEESSGISRKLRSTHEIPVCPPHTHSLMCHALFLRASPCLPFFLVSSISSPRGFVSHAPGLHWRRFPMSPCPARRRTHFMGRRVW